MRVRFPSPAQMSDDDIRTARGIVIPAVAMRWSFARAGGAGGQNVNKVSTKASVELNSADLQGPATPLARALAVLPDVLRVSSQTARSQWRNRQLCIERLIERIDDAAAPPLPPRRATRPSRGAMERRLQEKKRRSETKTERRNKDW